MVNDINEINEVMTSQANMISYVNRCIKLYEQYEALSDVKDLSMISDMKQRILSSHGDELDKSFQDTPNYDPVVVLFEHTFVRNQRLWLSDNSERLWQIRYKLTDVMFSIHNKFTNARKRTYDKFNVSIQDGLEEIGKELDNMETQMTELMSQTFNISEINDANEQLITKIIEYCELNIRNDPNALHYITDIMTVIIKRFGRSEIYRIVLDYIKRHVIGYEPNNVPKSLQDRPILVQLLMYFDNDEK